MRNCKLAWAVSGILVIAIAAISYKYIFSKSITAGNVANSNIEDRRQVLMLSASERDLILAEMRLFLSSVQAITSGVSAENISQIIKAARKVGARAQPATPDSLANKLPVTFKKLGRDTHKKFDLLALDAEQLGDPQYSLQQLSELMNNCVACHSTYKISLKPK